MSGPHRVLLVGASGQLGRALRTSLAALGEVRALTRADVDLSTPARLPDALAPHLVWSPTVIVNAAAYTAVDRAESEPDLAHAVNGAAPGVLAGLAAQSGAALVHYSTDYVFDGSGTRPWSESDPPAPLSVYGASKVAGERAVAEANARHLILRTSWLFSAHGSNFLRTILQLAETRSALRVVDDQVGAPTSVGLVADVTTTLLRTLGTAHDEDPRWGRYHVAPDGFTSWHGYAQHVVATALRLGRPLALTPDAIAPIPTSDYPLPARRPHNSRLDTHKLRVTFGVTLPDWRVDVDHTLHHLAEDGSP